MEYTLRNLWIRDVLMVCVICGMISYFVPTYMQAFVSSLLFLLWFFIVFKRNEEKVAEIKSLIAAINWRQVVKVFLAMLGFAIGIGLIVVYVFYTFYGDIDNLHLDNKPVYIVDYLDMCLLAPINEEIIFRGVILNRLCKKLGTNKAIIISSVLFALGHSPIKYLSTFVFGVFCSLIYLRSRNLMNNIALHIINNSSAGIVSFLSSFIVIDDNNDIPTATDLLFAAILVIASTIYLVRYIKNNWRPAVLSASDVCVNAESYDGEKG